MGKASQRWKPKRRMHSATFGPTPGRVRRWWRRAGVGSEAAVSQKGRWRAMWRARW
jgi:hypothetical protein